MRMPQLSLLIATCGHTAPKMGLNTFILGRVLCVLCWCVQRRCTTTRRQQHNMKRRHAGLTTTTWRRQRTKNKTARCLRVCTQTRLRVCLQNDFETRPRFADIPGDVLNVPTATRTNATRHDTSHHPPFTTRPQHDSQWCRGVILSRMDNLCACCFPQKWQPFLKRRL